MTIEWDCTGCWQSFEYDVDAAAKRLEQTTVYQPDREAEAFVCDCGALLTPYLDDV